MKIRKKLSEPTALYMNKSLNLVPYFYPTNQLHDFQQQVMNPQMYSTHDN